MKLALQSHYHPGPLRAQHNFRSSEDPLCDQSRPQSELANLFTFRSYLAFCWVNSLEHRGSRENIDLQRMMVEQGLLKSRRNKIK